MARSDQGRPYREETSTCDDAARRTAAFQIRKRRYLAVSAALLIALPAAVRSQGSRAPIVAQPQHTAGGTDSLYYLDLGNGTVIQGDRLRRDPSIVRLRRLDQNLFREIGRPLDQPAAADEILLAPIHNTGSNVRAALFVETSTGYVAFFDQLGRGGVFGEISTTLGRPFGPLASPSGNYALLMRHDSSGRTEGAYLYHAASGRGLYLGGVAKLEAGGATGAVSGFPRLAGQASSAELQSSEATVGYLVADAADGTLRVLDVQEVQRIEVRDLAANLFPTFPAETATPTFERFVSAPIRDAGEDTTHVLFVDAATGALAVLAGFQAESRTPTWTPVGANLFGVLGTTADAGARTIAAVEGRAANGATHGVWLIDSLTRRIAYVEDPATPASARVRRVTTGS